MLSLNYIGNVCSLFKSGCGNALCLALLLQAPLLNAQSLEEDKFSEIGIAQKLDEHIGKVELILALRGR